jgi:hypothetical protein
MATTNINTADFIVGSGVTQDGNVITVAGGGGGTLNDLTDVTITTPADGQVLTYDSGTGEWVNEAPTGGGTPGGSTTQVQYNNAGVFGGITGATTDGTNLSVTTPTSANHAANKTYVDSVVVTESTYAKIQAIWYHLNSF